MLWEEKLKGEFPLERLTIIKLNSSWHVVKWRISKKLPFLPFLAFMWEMIPEESSSLTESYTQIDWDLIQTGECD